MRSCVKVFQCFARKHINSMTPAALVFIRITFQKVVREKLNFKVLRKFLTFRERMYASGGTEQEIYFQANGDGSTGGEGPVSC